MLYYVDIEYYSIYEFTDGEYKQTKGGYSVDYNSGKRIFTAKGFGYHGKRLENDYCFTDKVSAVKYLLGKTQESHDALLEKAQGLKEVMMMLESKV